MHGGGLPDGARGLSFRPAPGARWWFWLALLALAAVGTVVALWPRGMAPVASPSPREAVFLGPQADHYLDPTGIDTIEVVASRPELFAEASGRMANRGVSPSARAAFWLRVAIPEVRPGTPWVLSLRDPRVIRAVLYVPAGAGWRAHEWNRVADAAEGQPLLLFPAVMLPAADVAARTLFWRIETTSSLRAMVWLESERAFTASYAASWLGYGMLIGIQLGLFCYLLAIGWALKDEVLLRLGALVLAFVVYVVSDRGILATLLLPGAFTLMRILSLGGTFLIFALWIAFEAGYLKLRSYLPRLARAASVVSVLLGLCALVVVVEVAAGQRMLRLYSAYLGLGAIGFGVAIAAAAIRHTPRRALAFLICWLPAIAGGVARLAFDAVPTQFNQPWLVDFVYVGVAFSLLLFGLITSFDLQRRERRLRAEAEASEARFRSFADSTSDSFWETDPGGRLVNLTGVTRKAAQLSTGDHLIQTLRRQSIDGAEPLRLLSDAVANRRPFRSVVLAMRTLSGEPCHLALSGTPAVDASGRYIGYRGTIADITQERLAAERQAQQQKMAALGQLAGGIAHEINNLLHPIINLGRRVRDGLRPDDERRYQLGLVVDAAVRAREIVAGVLTSARGQPEPNLVVPLREAVEKAAAAVRAIIPEAVVLDLQLSDGEGPRVRPGEVLQVLSNLVSNAVHAVHGAGRIEVTLAADPDGDAVLTVADDGEGMDPETRRKAMEPFFTTKGPSAGTGLGLPVVYGIVGGWGGTVDILSERGRGTRVVIRVPQGQRADRARQHQHERGDHAPSAGR